MKTNKVLAIALSAGLVLGGASYAHAEDAAPAQGTQQPAQKTIEEVRKEAVEKLKKAGFSEDSFVIKQINKSTNPAAIDSFVEEAIISHQVSNENNETGYSSEKAAKEAGEQELVKNKMLETKEVKVTANANGDKFFYTFVEKDVKVDTPAEKEEEKDQTPDWMKGLYTEDQLEDALATARGNLLLDGLQDLYDVEAVFAGTNDKGEKLYAISRVPKKVEEEKPEDNKKPEVKPEDKTKPVPVPTPDYSTPTPGEDDKVVVPEEKPEVKPEDKKEDKKETEVKEEKTKTSKDKKEEAKPARKKCNNPKTGIESLAPIYSTLAISMAGIVAARKKND